MSQIRLKPAFNHDGVFMPSLYITLVLIFLSPLQAKADVAVPTLLFIWPASWVLLLAIIPVEYFIARKVLALSHKSSFLLSLTANAISSAAGIPIAWIITTIATLTIDFSIYSAWKNVGSIDWYDALVKVTGETLFLAPGEPIENYFHKYLWTVPVAILFLLLPYFFASVWIEGLVANRFIKDKVKAAKWSWTANGVSYGLMLIALTCFLLPKAINDRSLTFIEGDLGGTSGVDVYAFREEQIDAILSKERIDGKHLEARVLFEKLPFSDALVHEKSGPSSGQFNLSLPKHGKFVIASSYKGYDTDANGHAYSKQFFWLVRLRTNEDNTLKLKLTNKNMIDSESPDAIKLNNKQ